MTNLGTCIPEWLIDAHKKYMDGYTLSEIESETGIERSKISKWFKKFNLCTKKMSKIIPNTEVSKVAERYSKGETLESLAKEYDCSLWSIRNILKQFSVKTLTKQERNTELGCGINFNYFESTDKEGPAYFYGLITTDGNIHNNSFQIGLQARDEQILEVLKDELNITNKIISSYPKSPKGKICHAKHLKVMDRRLIESLKSFGLTERKSGKETVPDCYKLNRHFWRGVVDGDGCISISSEKLTVYVIGSYELCNDFKNFVITECNEKAKASVLKCSNCDKLYVVRFSSGIAESILSVLYDDSKFFIERKLQKYKEYLKLKSSST